MDASAERVVESKPAPSAGSAGSVTRKGARNEPAPEEALEILVDHLKRLDAMGIHIELIPTIYRMGHKCAGFLVMDCELVEGHIRKIEEAK